MKKLFLSGIAAITLSISPAFAVDNANTRALADKGAVTKPEEESHGEGMTLAEARKKAHAFAEKLDKMTEAEWAERQKRHHAFMEKWNKMTPEEKEAYRQKQKAKRMEKREKEESGKSAENTPAEGKQPGK